MDLETVIVEIERFLGERGLSAFPSEFSLGGVYLPPLFVASILGVTAATVTVKLMNRFRLARFFFYPPIVFVALMVIYTGLISNLILPV
jgi:hypothetical protein